MEFVAIDVETANYYIASICQVGIAAYQNNTLIDEWKTYVNPEDDFDPMNILIHGINETTVEKAPKFPEIIDKINSFLTDRICVCHTHFDRISILEASEIYGLKAPNTTWLDSAMVARRTWKQFAQKGYGLHDICGYLKYKFVHHDALEDAKAAAHILITAVEETGLDIEAWLKRVRQPIDLSDSSEALYIKRDGNPEGPLFGEVIAFTGALSMRRKEAADLAALYGCQVESGVNKQTSLLVVGDQDIRRLAGCKKSSKQRKAEELIAKGQSIRILGENDFRKLADIFN